MTNTVDEMRAKILFDVIKEPCGMDTILSTEDATGTILNAEGQVVVSSFTLNANQNHEINTENIASGVYMIKVANQNFVSFKKLVVKK